MTIWYISKYCTPPGRGQVGGRGYLLMRELANLGHCPVVITSDSNHLSNPPSLIGQYYKQNIGGVDCWWVKTFKYSQAKSIRRIISWMHFEWRLFLMPCKKIANPDVVIISSLSLFTIANGLWFKYKYKCRLVFEVRDIWPLTLVEEGGFSSINPFIWFLAFFEWLGYKYADVLVGTMPNLQEHVASILGYPRTVHCIPMGIVPEDLNAIGQIDGSYIKKYIPRDKFVVGYVGSIGITNALDTFFQCALILENRLDIVFLVVGEGGLKCGYEKQYGKLRNVVFAPRVPKEMVQSVLSFCDVVYLSVYDSTVWKYGQSLNKLIDYMIAGKPVIASYSGFPSMIDESSCGVFVPARNLNLLRDTIIEFAALPKVELLKMGDNGRHWILKNRAYCDLAVKYLKIISV